MPPVIEQVNVAARELVGDLEQRVGGRRRFHIIVGVVAAALLLLLGRAFFIKPPPKLAPPPRQVFVAKVTTSDVPLYLDEIGTTAAYETVEVKAQVSGQIVSRDFKDGADVKKGDLLFTIEPRPYEAALEQAKAQAILDQLTLKRQQELRARNVVSPQDMDTAQANALKSEAAAKAAQVNYDFCFIKSPIDGRVGLRNVDIGNLVGPTSPSLVTIHGLDPIYTDFTVAEPDLPQLRKYLGKETLKVVTDAENDSVPPRTGELYFLDTAVQPGIGTVKARAITPNSDHALWPSQFVHVRLILDVIKDAKLVPSTAVQIGQNGPYVFVVKQDSTLELRKVKPGQVQDDLTVVNEGLKEGESVVVSGQLQLAPGAKVVVKPMEQPADTPSPAENNS